MHLRYDPQAVMSVGQARDFGRVAVLMGGDSSERARRARGTPAPRRRRDGI